MKTKNKVIYISLGFQELKQQLYSRVANVRFVRRADRDHYLFTTVDPANQANSMIRGSTSCDFTLLKATIYESNYPTPNPNPAMDPDWDWSARYIVTNAAKKNGLNGGFNEFKYVDENTKIIITGHGKVDSNYLYTHIWINDKESGNKLGYYDAWAYPKDRIDFIGQGQTGGGRISLSELADIIKINIEKHNPNYHSSIESPLHISLSSCLMAFTSSYDPKNAGAAKFLTALKKKGITAEIRARVTSEVTPDGADEQQRMGLKTGAIGSLLETTSYAERKKKFLDKIIRIGGSSDFLKTHKKRGYNFTYKWETNTKMTVVESSDPRADEERNKEQIIMNLYYIAYRTKIGDKRKEILNKIKKYTETKLDPSNPNERIPVMYARNIVGDLRDWVGNRSAQIHNTGALYFGTANSVKVIRNMIEEFNYGEIKPYRESKENLTNAFLFMRQKVTILENLYLLAYRTNLSSKQEEILTKAEALQLQADSSAASDLLTDWVNTLDSQIYLDSGMDRFGHASTGTKSGDNVAVKTIKRMVSELSQKKTITVLLNE